MDTVCLVELCGHFLAHCSDDCVRRDFFFFICLNDASPAGRVMIAQLHHSAEKLSVL